MDWLNLHSSVLDSPEFLGAEPLDRATWLCLLRYCIGQENGGVITDCADWGDRKWQQLCRITKKEATRTCDLWGWDGTSMRVRFYPKDKEEMIQRMRTNGGKTSERKAAAARENGKLGGRRKKPTSDPSESQEETEQTTHGEPIEGKGREGNRKGREAREPMPAGGSSESDSPDADGLADSLTTPTAAGPGISNEERWDRVEKRQPWAVELGRVVSLTKWNWAPWKALVDDFGGVAPVLTAYRANPEATAAKLRKALQAEAGDVLPPSDEAVRAVLEMGQEGGQ